MYLSISCQLSILNNTLLGRRVRNICNDKCLIGRISQILVIKGGIGFGTLFDWRSVETATLSKEYSFRLGKKLLVTQYTAASDVNSLWKVTFLLEYAVNWQKNN